MRQIKFRGKRLNGDGWIFGDILQYPDNGSVEIIQNYNDSAWVDPATVGQFTGLIDKNGKEIFEGDILRSPHFADKGKQEYLYHTVEWCDYLTGWLARNTSNESQFGADGRIAHGNVQMWVFMRATEIEVIGNIHDSPELLKKE